MANALAITEEQTEFTPAQKQALQALGIGAVTPGDLHIFLATCQQTGLNPFLKEIYLIRRGDKSTIQVGIDGLLTIADRITAKTGEAYGISPIYWCGGDGVWRDVWLPATPPAAAKVIVKRRQETFTAVALFREFAPVYNGKLSGLWAKMPAHMIGKVAMAHALRRAFPAAMSGVYTDDEMEQAGPAAQAQAVQVQATPARPAPRVKAPAVKAPAQPVQTAPVQTAAATQQPRQAAPQPAPVQTESPQQPAQPAKQQPAQPEPAPVQGAHWTTHRVDPWAMPAPEQPTAAQTTAEGNDWRRHVQQPAAKPAAAPAAQKNAKEQTK